MIFGVRQQETRTAMEACDQQRRSTPEMTAAPYRAKTMLTATHMIDVGRSAPLPQP